jgi:hypothetical protein
MRHPTIALVAPALLVAGYLFFPVSIRATDPGDSEKITKLLGDTKDEAVQLKLDSADLAQFTYSNATYVSYSHKITLIREHVNETGKLLAELQQEEASGSPWQQAAIQQIEPLLRELADNTTAVIERLNENKLNVHFPEFKEYARANYELATDLEALIHDFVSYSEAKEKMEQTQKKINPTE